MAVRRSNLFLCPCGTFHDQHAIPHLDAASPLLSGGEGHAPVPAGNTAPNIGEAGPLRRPTVTDTAVSARAVTLAELNEFCDVAGRLLEFEDLPTHSAQAVRRARFTAAHIAAARLADAADLAGELLP